MNTHCLAVTSVLSIATGMSCVAALATAVEVTRITIPATYQRLAPRAMSDDCATVVGVYQITPSSGGAFIWKRGDEVVLLSPPLLGINVSADAVSGDGSTVVGNRYANNASIAIRWTAAEGVVDLQMPVTTTSVKSLCVNRDGSVIAGKLRRSNSFKPWVWTRETGIVEIAPLEGGTGGVVNAMTPDGSILVGTSYGISGRNAPTKWTLTRSKTPDGSTALSVVASPLPIPADAVTASADVISADGETIGGFTGTKMGAVRWDASGSASYFSPETDPTGSVFLCSISADGAVLAGSYSGFSSITGGFAWSELSKFFALKPFLSVLGISEPIGNLAAMNGDATAFLFQGFSTTVQEAWLVTDVPRADAPRCASDFDANRIVDDRDFEVFANAYSISDCADTKMPANCPADLDRDGFVTDADFAVFASRYSEVLCPR